MLLTDHEIIDWNKDHDLITPFIPEQRRMGALSYGLSHVGYDIRIAGEVFYFNPLIQQVVDPAGLDTGIDRISYLRKPLNGFVLKPGAFVLVSTFETFNMPDNIAGLVYDKSTLARLGLAVQNTIAEPGWNGYLTVEISNHGSLDIILRDCMPIAQMCFSKQIQVLRSYHGRYQNQKRFTPALAFTDPG